LEGYGNLSFGVGFNCFMEETIFEEEVALVVMDLGVIW
jgi:hypothetical protein